MDANGNAEAPRHLHGRWLLVARMLWIAVAVVGLTLFVAGIPVYFAQLQIVDGCMVCGDQKLTQERLSELQSLGISVAAYAAYFVGIEVIFALIYCVVAAVIFWRRPDEPQALFGAFMLLTWGITFPNTIATVAETYSALWLPVNGVSYIGVVAFVAFFCLFPHGRFIPRWTPWLVAGWGVTMFLVTFFPNAPVSPSSWPRLLSTMYWAGFLGGVVWSQIYRYRKVSNAVQRQQTKWVVFGLSAALLGFVTIIFIGSIVQSQASFINTTSFSVIGITGIHVSLMLVPLSIAFAILRSGLWDIDIIINRTLVYGALTITLALIYVGSVVLLRQLFARLTGGSEPAIVASTLAIAALFTPMRRRIQNAIDKRFYRRKYDAAKVLQAFGARLRDETDLDALTADLLRVVDETMQPAHISLWLREPDSGKVTR